MDLGDRQKPRQFKTLWAMVKGMIGGWLSLTGNGERGGLKENILMPPSQRSLL